jgi:hypothetical protein
MSEVSEAARKKDGLRTWTIIIDCLSHNSKTPFPLQGWGAIIKEYNIKIKTRISV